MINSSVRKGVMLMAAFALISGCVTPPRADPSASPATALLRGGSPTARMNASDPNISNVVAQIMARASASADGSFDILSVSGGGARGAFGAGSLVGLSRAGRRPQFEIVTGVSAGALIAPFAFLGSDWDPQLSAAFAGSQSSALMRPRGLAALFSPGVFSARPLKERVDRFVTLEMIDAVANESRQGRYLLVQTTDLDAQAAVLWNMGEIAEIGGESARTLFRDVLLASSSVPGVFPPVMFDVEADGRRNQEMHVDGGVVSPFVLTPLIAMLWRDEPDTQILPGNLFIFLNGPFAAEMKATPRNTASIVSRSFETSQMYQARTSLAIVTEFARKRQLNFRFTYIPSQFGASGSLDLKQEELISLFNHAATNAETGEIWWTIEDLIEGNALTPGGDFEPAAGRKRESDRTHGDTQMTETAN